MKTEKKYASVFELNGVPKLTQAFPLALQHVVAMIVGCVTPAIVIAEMAGLNEGDKVIFVQAALFIAAVYTDSAVPAWRQRRFRTSGDYGGEFCLSAKYAGDRW